MMGYASDLARIHEEGFTRIAGGAASVLIDYLTNREMTSKLIVELGCGGGTLARKLVDAEFDVTGFDQSEAFIRMAAERVPEASLLKCSFLEADLPSDACAVAAIGEVFNYLFDPNVCLDTLGSLLGRIYECLAPGGVLLFDIAGPQRAHSGQSFKLHDDWAVLVENGLQGDLLTRKITSFARFDGPEYRRTYEEHVLRLIDPKWVAERLQQVGFSVQRLDQYGDVNFPPGLHGFLGSKPNV